MMGKTSDVQEVYYEHPGWLFVIIPVQDAYKQRDGYTEVPATYPLFAAYCKRCHKYATKRLAHKGNFILEEGSINLPKYGCVGPEIGEL